MCGEETRRLVVARVEIQARETFLEMRGIAIELSSDDLQDRKLEPLAPVKGEELRGQYVGPV